MCKIFISLKDWREFRRAGEFREKSLGFVPTMGNLHEGHRSLLERSTQQNDLTVLSIFVNPTQFDNAADLKCYPRTQEADIQIAKEMKVDCVLIPTYDDLYPDDYTYKIQETQLSKIMEGKHRLGHFDGMLTVVLKLLQLVKATRAYFGEKDYQQLILVKEMVKAFFIDTDIIGCPTTRDEKGLALSSRNNRLDSHGYTKAVAFADVLKSSQTIEILQQRLLQLGIEVDYVEDYFQRRFAAIKIGDIRLIDNIKLESAL